MSKSWHIPRRTFLKGLGTSIALPIFESMVPPLQVLAGNTTAPSVAERPLRMAFLYVPNGMNMADWKPEQTGTDYQLPPTLAPLADLRSDFQVITGLAHDKAFANGDGAGDHA